MRQTSVLSAAFLAAILFMPGCVLGSPFTATEIRHEAVAHVANTGLAVEVRNGAITIMRDAGSAEVAINAELTAGGATQEEAESRMEQTQIVIDRDADGLSIAVTFPQPYVNGDVSHLTIRLSEASKLTARTSNGAISVADLGAPAVLTTSNGAVTLRGMAGEARVTTSNGRIAIEDHAGDIEARTSNGAVIVRGATGRVKARTSNGAIAVALTDDSAGPLDLQTSNGAITATVGSGFGGEVSILTSNGGIGVRDEVGAIKSRDVQRRRAALVMTRDGEPSRLSTNNGRIELRTAGPDPLSDG